MTRICDVIVVDTMAAVSPGGNENSAEDVGKLLQHCKWLHKITGALVILIAHSGKDQSRGMRGWSGAKAAADAEIEVTRNGDYRALTVTKAKDSTDGESLSFKLKVVELGMVDGEMESSCVIEHVENAPAEPAAKQRPAGKHELAMLDMLKKMAPSGTVNYEDLVEGYLAKMPAGNSSRSQRKSKAHSAIEGLCARKLAYMHGDDRVSLSSLVTSSDEGWLR